MSESRPTRARGLKPPDGRGYKRLVVNSINTGMPPGELVMNFVNSLEFNPGGRYVAGIFTSEFLTAMPSMMAGCSNGTPWLQAW